MIELEYIEGDGTQYIDTGVYPNGKYTVEMKARISQATTSWDSIFGTRNGSVARFTVRYGNTVNGVVAGQKSATPTTQYQTYSAITKTEGMNWHVYRLGTTFQIDSTTYGTYTTGTTVAFPYTLFLFAVNNQGAATGGNFAYMQLAYCKIWDDTNTLVRDYIPVMDENNEVCLYDRVSQTYFRNQGTGSFIGGDPVSYTKYLIESGGDYYTIQSDALVNIGSTLNAQLFTDYGLDAIPDWDDIDSLTNPSVLCWGNNESVPMTAEITGTPYPQAIISEAIDLTDSTITGVEGITATCEGNPTFAVSLDGTTWKMWNNSTNQWATLSDDTSGMSASVMADITSTVWNTFIGASTEFYIRFALLQTTDKVTNVTVDFTN